MLGAMPLSVLEALALWGGAARRGDLIASTSRAEVEAALSDGSLTVVGRGVYAGAGVDEARRTAAALCGVVSHLSAALAHGWAVKTPPALPEVTVPRGRRIRPGQQRRARVTHSVLGPDDVVDGVTSQDRTLLDCLRREPFDAGLSIVDSAVRGGFPKVRLLALVRDARGPGVLEMRRTARAADAGAANPFESVLRAIAMGVTGLHVRPQVPIYGVDFLGQPDLVDTDLRIVVEADSFAWHGDRVALRRDANRYNAFVVHGWLVLRFAWEDVMFEPELVRAVLEAAVRQRSAGAAS